MTFADLCLQDAGLAELDRLFSIVVCLDERLGIVAFSPALHNHLPSLTEGMNLLECFHFQRPARIHGISDINRNLGSLFLMVDTASSFALRGQIINHRGTSGVEAVFCGSPWLFWLSNNRPELRLGLDSFSPQDAQIDQLFYMNTERRMVQDLERINAELTQAKIEAEEAHAARDRFFTQISHEMRTPLNGVLSAIALLQDPARRDDHDDLLRLAGQSASNLLQVINYVLDVSKLASKQGALTPVDFDVRNLLESVIDVVRARAMEQSLVLRCDVADDVGQGYHGDANLLRQILLNLTMNAIKFTDHGGVSIKATRRENDAPGLRFEVSDTGIGIREEVQQNIFEPFATLHNQSPGTMGEGTGLGLDIARRNTEALGGSIGVTSAAGEGSTFWLEIPLDAASQSAPDHPAPDPATEPLRLQGRILLVDDNDTNLLLARMLIEGMGLTVECANGGEAAIDMALSQEFDAVLMDISMPDVDGYSATAEIRKVKSVATLPIIACTAHSADTERTRSREAGMTDYITKPIERDKLFAALAGALAGPTKSLTKDPATAPAEMALVNATVLETLKSTLGADKFQQVITRFLGEASERLESLLNAEDANTLELQAHALAGMSSSFGLDTLSNELRQLEALLKSSGETEINPDVQARQCALEGLAKASLGALRTSS